MEKPLTCGFGSSKKESACGFGRRKTRFGNNLGPTNSNFDSFYKYGTANSLNLNPNGCLSGLYNQPSDSLQRFGKKKFIQEISFEKKGTKGSFTRWCKSKGYPKVTTACIKRGKHSLSLKIRRKAIFAQNTRSKKRHYSFGKKKNYKKKNTLNQKKLVNVNKDINYLKGK